MQNGISVCKSIFVACLKESLNMVQNAIFYLQEFSLIIVSNNQLFNKTNIRKFFITTSSLLFCYTLAILHQKIQAYSTCDGGRENQREIEEFVIPTGIRHRVHNNLPFS